MKLTQRSIQSFRINLSDIKWKFLQPYMMDLCPIEDQRNFSIKEQLKLQLDKFILH